MKTRSKEKAVKIPPLPEGIKVPKGTLYQVKDYCKGCGYCVEFCPRKNLVMSKEYNRRGYHFPVIKDPKECIGCNLCGLLCPDFGIYFLPDKPARGGKIPKSR